MARPRTKKSMVSVQSWVPLSTREQVEELSSRDKVTVSAWIGTAIKEKLVRDKKS